MKIIFVLLLIFIFLISPSIEAASFDIELNILKAVDMLIALPLKVINLILGGGDTAPASTNQEMSAEPFMI